MLDSTADVLAAAVLRDRSASRRSRARVPRGRGRGLARARARERLHGHVLRPRRHGVEGRRVRGGRGPVAQAPVGARRRDGPRRLRGHVHPSQVAARAARRVLPLGQPARRAASANALPDPSTRARARRVASPPSSPRSRRTSQIADEGGPATHQLVAATVIPDRSAARRGARAIATEPSARRRPRLRPAQLLIQFVVLPRKMGTGRDSLEVRDPRPGPPAARRARQKRRKRRPRARPRADGRERRHVLHRRRGDAQARAQAGPAPARRPAS